MTLSSQPQKYIFMVSSLASEMLRCRAHFQHVTSVEQLTVLISTEHLSSVVPTCRNTCIVYRCNVIATILLHDSTKLHDAYYI